MDIRSFRVENFRSIRDTGWLPFSADNITVLVGQNESGKSSILDALNLCYCIEPGIDPDDFRLDSAFPRVSLSGELGDEEIAALIATQPEVCQEKLKNELKRVRKNFTVVSRIVGTESEGERDFQLSDDMMAVVMPLLGTGIEAKLAVSQEGAASESEDSDDGVSTNAQRSVFRQAFLTEVWNYIPEFKIFREGLCSLPNRIDVNNGKLAGGLGNRGARNFIGASDLDLASAIAGDHRKRETALSKASAKITRDLQLFWSQVLGRSDKISLSCELKNHASTETEKAGMPYLAFWVKEADQPLYPSQRSRGTRWFISFFLELFSGNKKNPDIIVLLDEPANYLHPAAQKDVIKLLEKLAKETKFVYSTHSPYMLDQKQLHRVLAVERRSGSGEESEATTVVRRGLELASASQLTLAPILDLIGVDLSQQQVIRKTRNLIVEEISAVYYIRALMNLLHNGAEIHIVPCGGVDTIRTIVDLFIAWGIKFTVLVDDDGQGKRVVRDIKAKYSMDDDESKASLQLIDGCEGIEDIFSHDEFKRLILEDDVNFDGANSSFLKRAGISKPMLAIKFCGNVERGSIGRSDFSEETQDRIRKIVSAFLESIERHEA